MGAPIVHDGAHLNSYVLLTYFLVASGFKQYAVTGSVPGHVNRQYIIEGLSSWFMFVLGGLGFIAMDVATEKKWSRTVRTAGVGCVFVSSYIMMSMLFLHVKIPSYQGEVPLWAPMSAWDLYF